MRNLFIIFILALTANAVQAQVPSISRSQATLLCEKKGYTGIEILYVLDGLVADLRSSSDGAAYPVPTLSAPNVTTVGFWAKRKGDTKKDFYQSIFLFDLELGWFQATIFDTAPGDALRGRRGVELLNMGGTITKDVIK